jgi:hypothetical protein
MPVEQLFHVWPLEEYLQQPPQELVFDGANIIDKTQIQADRSYQELINRGYHLVIVTLPRREVPDILPEEGAGTSFYQLLQEHGYGHPAELNLDPQVLGCSIDYGYMVVYCISGDAHARYLDNKALQEIQELMVEYLVNNPHTQTNEPDPTQAFIAALDQMLAKVEAHERRQQATPIPAATSIPAAATPEVYINQPTRPVMIEDPWIKEHQQELTGALIVFALAALYTIAEKTFLGKQRASIKETNSFKKNLAELRTKLETRVTTGGGYITFNHLISILENSYPDLAAEITQAKATFDQAYNSTTSRCDELQAVKVGYFAPRQEMLQLCRQLQHASLSIEELFRIMDEKQIQLEELGEREKAAENNLEQARLIIAEMKKWYEVQQSRFRQLPAVEQAMVAFDRQQRRAHEHIYGNATLLGSDLASEIIAAKDNFQQAVMAVIELNDLAQYMGRNITSMLGSIQPEQAPNLQALASRGDAYLLQAISGLSGDLNFGSVFERTKLAEAEYNQAHDYVSNLTEAIRQMNANQSAVDAITDLGFRVPDSLLLLQQSLGQLINQANDVATQSKWDESRHYLASLTATSQRIVNEMRNLVALHESNLQQLKGIAHNVMLADKRRTTIVGPKWTQLRDNYQPGNYPDHETHFTQITEGLEVLFDCPNDEHDLASQAHRLNNMVTQEFSQAQVLIASMQKKLSQMTILMDQLEARYDLVLRAERECDHAIELAQQRIEAAKLAKDGDKDRLVDVRVDELIEQAETTLNQARDQRDQRIYVGALELAGQASKTAIEAKNSADEQVEQLLKLFKQLTQAETDAREGLNKIEQTVTDESNNVVSRKTLNLLEEADRQLLQAQKNQQRLANYEDRELAEQLKLVIGQHGQVTAKVKQVGGSLKNDREEHQGLLNNAGRQITAAERAIRSAESSCGDYRAGSAGDYQLRTARSLVPNKPIWGATKSQINQVIEQANQAISNAQQAERDAKRAIAAYEEEQRRKAAAQRAAEEARRAALTSSSGGGGNTGGGTRITPSGGGNTGGGTRITPSGGGNTGGGTKFG